MLPTDAVDEQHEWAKGWAKRVGVEPESHAYLKAVRDWRHTWRPERVRILLIGESHVAEQSGDDSVRVQMPLPLANLPDSFVRLVYCLGYGDNRFCNPLPTNNPGTWQFWDLFGALLHGLDSKMPRARSGADRATQLVWKVDVLNELSARGIWLVDASVVGLYSPGRVRPFTRRNYREMIRDSYIRFVWPCVASEPLEQVWTVGRGVGDALTGAEGIDSSRIVSQPQDRNRSRYLADLERMVRSVGVFSSRK